MTDLLQAALAQHFGFSEFHRGQRAVIEDVLAGRPTVAVMPTGAGKSLCYQLPALLLDGVTLVVSPLIALMKDQVDGLRARGIAAEFINSTQSPDDQRAILDRLLAGQVRLVYVAPERFRQATFLRTMRQVPLSLFAVDEAHCISRWGHDFRPDYTRLGEVIEALQPPRVLACTATATPEVRADIHATLRLASPSVHVAGFLRENLFLESRLCGGDKDRDRRIEALLRLPAMKEGAIVLYASTRKRVERYAQLLRQVLPGEPVVAYHGGMDDEERSSAQDRFMSGRARIAVATNAFGMGVDRSDVRAVIHVDLPRTVEGYYQEVGRAGRDSTPSRCLLLHNPTDTRVHEFLIDRSHPPVEVIGTVWHLLHSAGPESGVSQSALERHLSSADLDGMVEPALRQLARVDAAWFDGAGWRMNPGAPADVAALGLDFEGIQRHRAHELEKLNLMRRFAQEPGCRHAFILDYFGEAPPGKCPGCDRCQPDNSIGGVPGLVHEQPGPEERLVLRKALAGVARAEGRFGLRKVAAMLAGARVKIIEGTTLPDLTTFGILKELGTDGCAELLKVLVDQGLCRLVGGEYPVLEIAPEGWEVMQDRRPPSFRPPPHLVPGHPAGRRIRLLKGPTPVVVGSGSQEVLDALRRFRTELARSRSVPPYVIFSDKVLQSLAANPPLDESAFLAVAGLGPGKWSQFGPALLEVLAPFAA
jgi:ATP-dependent DNA helicase RecQ